MPKLVCYMSTTHMTSRNDWIACLERAKRMGFEGVELFGGENGINLTDMPEERCMAVAARARALGMRLSVHPWVEWENLSEAELLARYRALIGRCIRMEAQEINMHLHFLASRGQGMRRVFAATDPCVEMLEQANATLLYENVPEHGARELGSEAMDFEKLFGHYGSESPVKLNIDTGHAHIMHQIAPLTEDYGDRWRYTHIHDNDGLSDLHKAPGAGTLDFAAFAERSKQAGYTGVLMMEFHETGLSQGMPVLEDAYGRAGFGLTEITPNP